MDLTGIYRIYWASSVAQLVKNPPAMWETWVQYLDWEDPLEKGKATHSSILAWRISCTVWGHKELDTTERLSLHFTSQDIPSKSNREQFSLHVHGLSLGYILSWATKQAFVNLRKLKSRIISSIFSNNNAMRLEINYREKNCKKHKHVKAKQYIKQWIKEETKEVIKKYLDK